MAKEEIKVKEKKKTKDEEVLDDIVASEDKKVAEVIDKEMERERRRNETREQRQERQEQEKLDAWVPKTELGKEVRAGKIKKIDEIFESGRKILEPEIVDLLLKLRVELLDIGQAKGKFGGGKRRAWKQTQKKTKEGNVPSFNVMAVVGDGHGHIGIGYGRASETLPAKEKAIRKAKLNVVRIKRGCASFDCSCDEPHSIPAETSGKCSSVSITLMPAAQGTGLVAGDEIKKILKLAGIKDIYTRSFGKIRTTINHAKACMQALNKLGEIKG